MTFLLLLQDNHVNIFLNFVGLMEFIYSKKIRHNIATTNYFTINYKLFMATIKPFKGIRPPKNLVEKVASRPYDVLNSDEARAEAAGNRARRYWPGNLLANLCARRRTGWQPGRTAA